VVVSVNHDDISRAAVNDDASGLIEECGSPYTIHTPRCISRRAPSSKCGDYARGSDRPNLVVVTVNHDDIRRAVIHSDAIGKSKERDSPHTIDTPRHISRRAPPCQSCNVIVGRCSGRGACRGWRCGGDACGRGRERGGGGTSDHRSEDSDLVVKIVSHDDIPRAAVHGDAIG
jgi:hypothetical protein